MKIINFLIAILLLTVSSHAYAASQLEEDAKDTANLELHTTHKYNNITPSDTQKNPVFDAAAQKFVTVLEAQLFSLSPYDTYNQQFQQLASRGQSEGLSQELVMDYLAIKNRAQAHIATDIGISVFDLPDFYRYFYNNITRYVLKSSAIYAEVFDNTPRIMKIERIKVVCSGVLCRNSFTKGWGAMFAVREAFTQNNIPIFDKVEVAMFDENNRPIPEHTGVWLNPISGDPVQLTTAPCEKCNLN